MNCREVQVLLSAYYDDELPPESRTRVAEHLEACPACAAELSSFASLSSMARAIPSPLPPSDVWPRLERRLAGAETAGPISVTRKWCLSTPRLLVLAATVLVAIVGTWWLTSGPQPEDQDHSTFVAEFGEYLAEFQRSPIDAQGILVSRYDGEVVDASAVVQQVGYRPAISRGLPPGYTVQSTVVLDMPCCRCIQSLCKRSDGGAVAIFEHSDDELHWFGDRPEVEAMCQGKECRLVELENRLAASWKLDSRHLTVIGIESLEELHQLVAWFGEPPA